MTARNLLPQDYVARVLSEPTLGSPPRSLGGVGGGGKPAAQMDAEFAVWRDAQPMRVRCRCGYRYEGPAGKALAYIQRHRERRHPELAYVGKGKRAREHRRAQLLAERRAEDAGKRAA